MEEDSLEAALGIDIFPDEENSSVAEEVTEEFFFLWDSLEQIYGLFQVARYYIVDYQLPPVLIIELLKEAQLPLAENLLRFQYMLNGYLEETVDRRLYNG